MKRVTIALALAGVTLVVGCGKKQPPAAARPATRRTGDATPGASAAAPTRGTRRWTSTRD